MLATQDDADRKFPYRAKVNACRALQTASSQGEESICFPRGEGRAGDHKLMNGVLCLVGCLSPLSASNARIEQSQNLGQKFAPVTVAVDAGRHRVAAHHVGSGATDASPRSGWPNNLRQSAVRSLHKESTTSRSGVPIHIFERQGIPDYLGLPLVVFCEALQTLG
jgi:hypothetical protein